ncbi:alpha/beta fold hydrolase [Paraburkholderia graminis]|uniref:alpha/beta fold hydrolase n=1 Tax=Paraburkholderia graminis TaxID=60548 RepID=UPI00278F4283|nr:alpha/beta hydrolase [Paraburkholderia graminis]MDQ0621023.1 pimeloyl-ACP methyl ester carboxylesterase [Paraburkholderia graminis]
MKFAQRGLAAIFFAMSVSAFAATGAASLSVEIVKRGNVQIQVLSQGKGPTVVILPSLGRSVRDYDQVAEYLVADGFRVLRPEPRGVGKSKGPMENLSVHDFAADVAMVIDEKRAGPVVVVGHAWGNFAARQLAADRPDLVKGVVVAAASAGKVPPGSTEKPINAEMRKAIDGAGDLRLPEAQRLQYLKEAFFAPGNDPSVWLGGWHPETHEAEGHARNTTPVDDYFAAGTAPILDLQGENDAVAPRRFSQVLKSMLGERVTVVVLPNAGHAMAPEQPKAMADAIATFAKQVNQ